MSNQNVVLAWKTGGDFHFSDVNLLAYHIRKQYKGADPLKIYCITDTVNQEMAFKNVTLIPAGNKEWPGWWTKMNLFAPDMEKYKPFLYLDLDTAIVGDLSGILPPIGYENEFICLSSFFIPPRKDELQSGMMWFPKGNKEISKIWDAWVNNSQYIIKKFQRNGGDQSFFRSIIAMTKVDWQSIVKDKIWSFKINPERRPWLLDLPKHLSVICFHGVPRIPLAAKTVAWVSAYVKEGKL